MIHDKLSWFLVTFHDPLWGGSCNRKRKDHPRIEAQVCLLTRQQSRYWNIMGWQLLLPAVGVLKEVFVSWHSVPVLPFFIPLPHFNGLFLLFVVLGSFPVSASLSGHLNTSPLIDSCSLSQSTARSLLLFSILASSCFSFCCKRLSTRVYLPLLQSECCNY